MLMVVGMGFVGWYLMIFVVLEVIDYVDVLVGGKWYLVQFLVFGGE